MDPARLQGYLPMRFSLEAGRPEVRWCYLGEDPLTEPFFDHSIEAKLQQPFNLFFQPRTSVESLGEFARNYGTAEPAGFIFHMSRCGSTLITQMLAALPQNLVLSEPSPLDSVLRIRLRHPQITGEQQMDWMRWMVAALGHPRRPEAHHVFIKFDCWHVVFLPLIRQVFPRVPYVFLYRDPVEVMVSQINKRGAQMMPSLVQPELYGIDRAEALTIAEEEYCARVLAAICRAALDHHQRTPLLLLNYRQLPDAVSNQLADHCGIDFAAAEIEEMREAARFNAKHPMAAFADDSADKRNAATPEILQQCEKHLAPLFEQLEFERLRQAETA